MTSSTNRRASSLLLLSLWTFALAACGDDDDSSANDLGTDAATADAGASCTSDAQCDDDVFCNGVERCTPTAAGADADGCVVATMPACAASETCSEALDVCQTVCDTAPDADGDGYVSAACVGGDDCDDSDAERFPTNPEICDPADHDEDCNGDTFGDRDIDGDGYVDAACCNGDVCGLDCNDGRREINPAATEVCNNVDEDCDGEVDEGVAVDGYRDRDFDGYGAIDTSAPDGGVDADAAVEADGGASVRVRGCPGQLGFSELSGDCDDANRARSPGLVEACDLVDNDCDGIVDNNTTAVNWYADTDEDGFGSASSAVRSCAAPTLPAGRVWVLIAFDCDDANIAVNPAAPEICDGRDNDCNGRADYVIAGIDTEDDDRDGSPDVTCSPGGDCNDLDATTYPGAFEACDERDNDCDRVVDDAIVMRTWYEDGDGDGDAEPGAASIVSCLDYRSTRALTSHDCDDADPTVYGGAAELCDGIVNDCGGSRVGEDLDEDGFLAVGATCSGGPRGSLPATDCNDGNAAISPGDAEICNGVDDDCDTLIDGPAATAMCGPTSHCRASTCRTGKRAFVTSTTYNGNLGGLAGADALCQARADAVSLGGTWKAYMVSGAMGLSRLAPATVPYVRTDGVRIANNWADLSDESLMAPLNVNESGLPVSGGNVWTGLTNVGGGTNQHCNNWTYGGGGCLGGSACGGGGEHGAIDNHWDGYYVFGCNSGYRLYCIEQ